MVELAALSCKIPFVARQLTKCVIFVLAALLHWWRRQADADERGRLVCYCLLLQEICRSVKKIHKRNLLSFPPSAEIAAECVTYSTNYQQRLTLEIWYTNWEQEPLNRCQQLPAPYKRLVHDLKRNQPTNNRRIENSQTTTDQSPQLLRFKSPTTVFLKTTLTRTITTNQ